MNHFLVNLFDIIAIDTKHLRSYLTPTERQYLNNTLNSIEDLYSDFYTDSEGENLEVLLNFLCKHTEDIALLWEDNSRKKTLLRLYMSGTISGNYECFRFDLSKFDRTYISKDETLTLYRIGRECECVENLGNSWSKDLIGLRSYVLSSSIDVENRPIFFIKINDSEVLCEGNPQENELILNKNFKYDEAGELCTEKRRQIESNP